MNLEASSGIRISVGLALTIGVCLFGCMSYTLGLPYTRLTGVISFAVTFAFFACLWAAIVIKNGIPARVAWLSTPWLILLIVYLVGLATRFDNSGVSKTIQLLGVTLFFVVMCSINWRNQSLQIWALAIWLFIPIYAVILAKTGMKVQETFDSVNYNPTAACMWCVLFCQLFAGLATKSKLRKAFFLISALCALILFPLSHSRSPLLAMAAMVFTYIVWGLLVRKKAMYVGYFIAVVVIITAFIYIYPIAADLYPSLVNVNNDVNQTYGKNIFSGREQFWGILTAKILKQPIFGYGSGAELDDYGNFGFSASDIYLQIGLQTGLVGIAVFVWGLWRIWRVLWEGRFDVYARLSGAILIGIMTHQTFESSLTQNNLAVGLLFWAVLAVGVSRTLNSVLATRQMSVPLSSNTPTRISALS